MVIVTVFYFRINLTNQRVHSRQKSFPVAYLFIHCTRIWKPFDHLYYPAGVIESIMFHQFSRMKKKKKKKKKKKHSKCIILEASKNHLQIKVLRTGVSQVRLRHSHRARALSVIVVIITLHQPCSCK